MARPKIALTFERLALVARRTGSDRFYEELAFFVAATLRCRRWLVMRYPRYAAPEFIFNEALSAQAVRQYLAGLYRLDPLIRLVRSGIREGIFVLSKLKTTQSNRAYFDRLFRMSLIYDEAAILLPSPGGSGIAVCVERAARQFSNADMQLLRILYPLVKSLHSVHLDRIFRASAHELDPRRGGGWAAQALLVMDKDGRPVFRNARWSALERQGLIPHIDIADKNPSRMRPIDGVRVLHWEELGDTFAIAPSGRIYSIEASSPGYITANFRDAVHKFQDRAGLTQRERDIVELVLQGYPNAQIAKRLGLAAGSVRNHRYRLYNKLDITTERELFFQFIDFLTEREATIPA